MELVRHTTRQRVLASRSQQMYTQQWFITERRASTSEEATNTTSDTSLGQGLVPVDRQP